MDRLLTTLMLFPLLLTTAEVAANEIEFKKHTSIDMYVDNDFTLNRIEKEYLKTNNELLAIKQVNYYFNQYPYIEDKESRSLNEYWKTPNEFLTDKGGDCEDYSIIKYFQLKSMGIDKNKLDFYYVYLIPEKTYHIMLGYKENENTEVKYLDNVSSKVVKQSLRNDVFILSVFNEDSEYIKATNKELKKAVERKTEKYSKTLREKSYNVF